MSVSPHIHHVYEVRSTHTLIEVYVFRISGTPSSSKVAGMPLHETSLNRRSPPSISIRAAFYLLIYRPYPYNGIILRFDIEGVFCFKSFRLALPAGEGARATAGRSGGKHIAAWKRTRGNVKFVEDYMQSDGACHKQVVVTPRNRSVAAVLTAFITQILVKTCRGRVRYTSLRVSPSPMWL